jgi:uncharacterized protein (TIRG00374 family)
MSPRLRSLAILSLKLALLAIACFIVSRQVDWLDAVTLADGTVVKGKILAGLEPEAKSVTIEAAAGGTHALAGDDWVQRSQKIGLRTTIDHLDWGWWCVGMAMILVCYGFGVVRWKLLLESQGIRATLWSSFRLTFIGFFSNNFMPGLTGGDLVKAVMIAQSSPGKRPAAVGTVIVDRILGLAMLALLSSVVILLNFSKFGKQGIGVFVVLGICALGFVACYSRRIRRMIKLSSVVRRLPGSAILMKIDDSLQMYRNHPREVLISLGLSLVSHFFNIGSVVIFGWALGIPDSEVSIVAYFATVPLIFIFSSVPISPAGWGVRELLFIELFRIAGVDRAYTAHLVLLSVLLGLSTLIWSLLGGVFMFMGRHGGALPPLDVEAVAPPASAAV